MSQYKFSIIVNFILPYPYLKWYQKKKYSISPIDNLRISINDTKQLSQCT